MARCASFGARCPLASSTSMDRTFDASPDLAATARPTATLVVLSAAFFCIAFDNTKLIVAMPSLTRELASEPALLSWIPEAYLLVYASLLLLGGALSERYGARRMLLLGLFIFALGSVVGGYVGSAAALIAVRALMAVGGALITPATLAAVKTSFHGAARARAIAVWTASYGVGAALGPVLAGVLLERCAWGVVLLVNAPVAALAFAGALWVLPRDPPGDRAPLDWLGAGLALTATALLVFAILEGPHLGWTARAVSSAAASAVVIYGLLVVWQRTAEHPMLDPALFRIARFRWALLVILVGYLAFAGVSFVVAQYLQLVRAFTPTAAGLLTTPLAGAMLAGTLFAPQLSARVGARRALVGSLLVGCAGAAGLAVASALAADLMLCVAMLPFGAGCGSAFVNATEVVIDAAPAARAGSAAAVNETAFEFGGAVGVAALSTNLDAPALTGGALSAAASHAMMAGAAALLIAAAIALTVEHVSVSSRA
jgi:EmrB/QacA subfamily drug resistance transporter